MRNEYRIEGNDVYINIHRKKSEDIETIISLEDLPRLLELDCSIYLLPTKNNVYAILEYHPWTLRKKIRLHRFIMDAPDELLVDHINRSTLDNRRENLRLATYAQNRQNVGARRDNISGHRGVHPRGNQWESSVCADGKYYYLGKYKTIEEASKVASVYRAALQPYSSDALEIENPVIPQQRVAVNNRSGITGITWSESQQKWRLFLKVGKKQHYGGCFADIEDAKVALEQFKQNIGYNH